jgi:hypothetical protein
MLIVEFDDVFVYRFDFAWIFAQPNDPGLPTI